MTNTFYGQWSPPVDQVLYENFFKNQVGGTLIECGAGDGLTESCGKFFANRGWKCINIEPEDQRYNQLIFNRSEPNNTNLKIVLGEINDGYIVDFRKSVQNTETGSGIRKSWTGLIKELELTQVDLFILDVEGQELKVIKGMLDSPVLPDIMCIEYTWDSVGLDSLTEMLLPLGYDRLFLSYNNVFFSRKYFEGPFFGETDHWNKLRK